MVALRLRMLPWAYALPVLKKLLPLPALARLAWARRRARRPVALETVLTAALRLRPVRSRQNCLERSLLLYRYLSWAGAEPTLATGLRSDGERLHGHAWVSVAGAPVGDSAEEVSTYTPVVAFGPRGAPESPAALWREDARADPTAAAVLNAARRVRG